LTAEQPDRRVCARRGGAPVTVFSAPIGHSVLGQQLPWLRQVLHHALVGSM